MQFRCTFADRLQNSGDQRREFLAVLRRFPFPPALKNVYPVTAPCVVIHRSVVTLDTVNRYFRSRRLLQECAGDQLRGCFLGYPRTLWSITQDMLAALLIHLLTQ